MCLPCDLNQFKLILARVQHKKQPQLCMRLFLRLRLQRRGIFSSSTSKKTMTAHHYHYLFWTLQRPCDLNQFRLILARVQHKKQPQLCTRLFSRLRLQRRGCFSSSTSRKTTTTHHYHYLLRGGQEKQEGRPEAAWRRLRRRRRRDVERRGAARSFNQHCYAAARSCAARCGAVPQPTLLCRRRLRLARRGGSTNIGASALRRRQWCCTLAAARH